MKPQIAPVYYGDYLQLDQLLASQQLESGKYGTPVHDEMLFIVTHQAYELWFKQMLHEFRSIIAMFSGQSVDEKQLGSAVARLERVRVIQQLLIQQITIIETMTPLDFLEFRDYLLPASGFQSIQFKEIEIRLGLRQRDRTTTDQEFFLTRLAGDDRHYLEQIEQEPSLLDLVNEWLQRIPFMKFGEFDFWSRYDEAVQRMLESDRATIQGNQTLSEQERAFQLKSLEATQFRFQCLLDSALYQSRQEQGDFRMNQQAMLAALFIHLYRDEPILHLPFLLLTRLVEIDELLTVWRSRHALMVHRMLGTKIGTGGSSGHDYLNQTADQNRVFLDLFSISTFLIPRSARPQLPDALMKSLGFYFGGSAPQSST